MVCPEKSALGEKLHGALQSTTALTLDVEAVATVTQGCALWLASNVQVGGEVERDPVSRLSLADIKPIMWLNVLAHDVH